MLGSEQSARQRGPHAACLRHVDEGREALVPGLHALPRRVAGVVLEEERTLRRRWQGLHASGLQQRHKWEDDGAPQLLVAGRLQAGEATNMHAKIHTKQSRLLFDSDPSRPKAPVLSPRSRTHPSQCPPACEQGPSFGLWSAAIKQSAHSTVFPPPQPGLCTALRAPALPRPGRGARLPFCSAPSSASVSTRPPRDTLMRMALGFMSARLHRGGRQHSGAGQDGLQPPRAAQERHAHGNLHGASRATA